MSCSHTLLKSKKITQFKLENSSQLYEGDLENRDQIIKKLDGAILLAKKSGPESMNFLASDLFLKGTDSSLNGYPEIAALLYSYILKLKPNDLYIKEKYSIELLKGGKIIEARSGFEELHKVYPDKSEYALLLGGIYNALSLNEKARTVYKGVLKKDKKNEQACIFLAKSFAIEQLYKKSIKVLKRCERNNPKTATFSNVMGKIYLDQKKNKLAIKAFQKAIKIDPDHSQSIIALALVYEEQGYFEKSLKLYEGFLKEEPQNQLVLSRVSSIYISQSKMKKALPHLEVLMQLDPENLNLKVKLGIVYSETKQLRKARVLFQQLHEQVPDSDRVTYYLGTLSLELAEFAEAIDYFFKVPKESSYYLDSNLQIATILKYLALNDSEMLKAKGYGEQLLTFDRSREIRDPRYQVEIAILKASYLEDIMKIEEAIELIKEISSVEAYTTDHQYYLASLFEKIGDKEKAREEVLKIIEREPKNAHAHNFYGYSLLEDNIHLDKAYIYISKAVELQPKDAYIRDSLGWFYYKTGEVDKAYVEIKKANKIFANEPTILKHLAIIEMKKNNVAEAKKLFREALKNSTLKIEQDEIINHMRQLDSERLPASKE